MKYTWLGNNYETYKPKMNSKKRLGLFSFLGLAVIADAIIPMTFGQITRGAYKVVKLNFGFFYR